MFPPPGSPKKKTFNNLNIKITDSLLYIIESAQNTVLRSASCTVT